MPKFTKTKTCRVKIVGLLPLMFDRYAGDNKTQLEPQDKLYLDRDRTDPDGGIPVYLPSLNIASFLSATNTTSAPKVVFDAKTYKRVGMALASSVLINEQKIPITRNGEPILFYGLDENQRDDRAGIHIEHHVARVKGGIPNPKERPVIELPWEIEFSMSVFPNPELSEDLLVQVFSKGGMTVGFGTFRPFYGKFELDKLDFSS